MSGSQGQRGRSDPRVSGWTRVEAPLWSLKPLLTILACPWRSCQTRQVILNLPLPRSRPYVPGLSKHVGFAEVLKPVRRSKVNLRACRDRRAEPSNFYVPLYDQGMSERSSFADLQQDPPPECLAAVADQVMPGSDVRIVQRFNGGIRCGVHAVELIPPSGRRIEFVMKRFTDEFINEDPAVFERERRVLEILPRSEVPAPRLVWADERAVFGVPTLLMTRVPGIPLMHVQARRPSSDTSWVRPVVRRLAQIHRTPLAAEDVAFLPIMDSETVRREMLAMPKSDIEVRVASLPYGADVWAALQRYSSNFPEESPVLVHGDFHAGNLLWYRDDVAGVVDWAEAKRGSPERDLAHLRWETILRYDPQVVDLVQHDYEEEIGHRVPDVAIWDLLLVWKLCDAIESWISFFEIEERQATTLNELEERRRILIARALERVK